jgi:calcineurin-like phosphoesterase family protein
MKGKIIMETIKNTNAKINAQMEFTIANGGTVWLMTDWHLIRYNKKTGEFYERDNAATILRAAVNAIKENDIVIFMGDLVDSECYTDYPVVALYRKLANICSVFEKAKKKYFLIGNNDTEITKIYKELGFDEAIPCILFRGDIVISHMPFKCKDAKYNIHGHLHIGDPDLKYIGYWAQYGVEKTRQHINVFNNDRRPVDLIKDVLEGFCVNGVPNDQAPFATTDMPKKRNAALLKETKAYYKELKR